MSYDRIDKWLNKILDHPDLDENHLAQKKIYWIASLAVATMILLLTLIYFLIFPHLRIILYYGLFLSFIFLQGVILPLINKKGMGYGPGLMFFNEFLVIAATFYCIVKLGGIPYSGGLIIVGLAQVFFTLNFWNKKLSLSIFILYVLMVIVLGIIHPHLKVHPEMTPQVNISLFVVNILWISGSVILFVMGFISQRVKMEKIETDKIRELDEAKTKLFTNITHEFRTPLTIISGMTDLIQKDPEKWLNEGCKKIESYAKILLDLVNQMLDLSRLEAGAMPVRMIKADINTTLRHVIELFHSAADQKKIEIIFINSENVVIMDHDPDKLMQIISNILSNCIRYTPPYGEVKIETEKIPGDTFSIIIKDNGSGISEKDLPHIFDRFFRGDQEKENENSGSGLGLALTKELVKLLNGQIIVTSEYGKGTQFFISLPVTTKSITEGINILPDKDPHLSDEFTPEVVSNKPILLIIEDNHDVILYLRSVLAEFFTIYEAYSGHQGIQRAFEFIPDLILTDIMMPVMDGIEVLKRLKNDVRTSHIPVLVLTAKDDNASRIQGFETGADAYLSKPFIKEELVVRLRSLFEMRNRLQEHYSSFENKIEPDSESIEDSFMLKIRELMISNIDNEQFGITDLCQELGMSRTNLYRKFRALTDKSVAEYLRSLRLYKSRELLQSGGVSVSEAAYRTGFKNIAHFSRVFTEEFGINPSRINQGS